MAAEVTNENRHRQVLKGVVVSDKMNKTRVIEVRKTLPHRLYRKKMASSDKFFIHDEKNESHVGDVVLAESTRPLSRHKSFRLTKIVEKRVAQ